MIERRAGKPTVFGHHKQPVYIIRVLQLLLRNSPGRGCPKARENLFPHGFPVSYLHITWIYGSLPIQGCMIKKVKMKVHLLEGELKSQDKIL